VRIEHEIRVKVDKELDEVFEENADLFCAFVISMASRLKP
jgi:archaeosine-15-forming tRNA-guanine transglycosylase